MTTAAETRDNECGGGTSEEFTLSRPYVLDTVFSAADRSSSGGWHPPWRGDKCGNWHKEKEK